MRRCATKVAVCLVAVLLAGPFMPCQAVEAQKRSKRLWWASVAVVVAATLLDVASSRGGVETNPMLRTSAGTFNTTRALLLKSVATGGMLATEAWVMRGSRNSDRSAATVNFVSGGALAGLAIRNWKVATTPAAK
jgi:hypothetical protein